MHSRFDWSTPPGCPAELLLRMLEAGDARRLATQLSCHQDIAGDGAFSLAMIAEYQETLFKHGAWFYRRLFWEAGLIGQVLYLEAEAAGVRATGIGCYFDDPVHRRFRHRGSCVPVALSLHGRRRGRGSAPDDFGALWHQVLNAHRLTRLGGQARMDTQASLDAGLLVGGDDELVVAQGLSLPAPLVQIQDSRGLGLEVRIARKDPASMLPRSNRVLVQPTPHRAVADAGHQARTLRLSRHVGDAESRQRQAQGRRPLASERLDLNRELWGERPGGVPGGLSLRDPPIAA